MSCNGLLTKHSEKRINQQAKAIEMYRNVQLHGDTMQSIKLLFFMTCDRVFLKINREHDHSYVKMHAVWGFLQIYMRHGVPQSRAHLSAYLSLGVLLNIAGA